MHRRNGTLHLSQKKYIRELINRAEMSSASLVPTPMIVSPTLTSTDGQLLPTSKVVLYRSIVGGLQYACLTRPDIAFAVNKLNQFMHCPTDKHWVAVKRVLRYLQGTIQFGLYYTPADQVDVTAFSDSDWGSSLEDRRSTSGFCIYIGGNLVGWSSKKQHVVARSTSEAGFRSVANTAADITWFIHLLIDLGEKCCGTPTIWCDNSGAVQISVNPVLHSKMKHVELDLHFVREKVVKGDLQINHIAAHNQVADLFTKPLSESQFVALRSKLGLCQLCSVSTAFVFSEEEKTGGISGSKNDMQVFDNMFELSTT